MTYLSADAVHTLLPRLTFHNRALIPLRRFGDLGYDYFELSLSDPEVDLFALEGFAGCHVRKIAALGFDIKWFSWWDGEAWYGSGR